MSYEGKRGKKSVMNGKEMHLTHESGLEVLQFIFPFFLKPEINLNFKSWIKKNVKLKQRYQQTHNTQV